MSLLPPDGTLKYLFICSMTHSESHAFDHDVHGQIYMSMHDHDLHSRRIQLSRDDTRSGTFFAMVAKLLEISM